MLLALALTAFINLNALDSNAEAQAPIVESAEAPELVEFVEVEHKQKGMLFALVPITFTATAIARADGTVNVRYPWYTALTLDKRAEVETKAKVAIDNTLRFNMVGSVRAEGKQANPRFSAVEARIAADELRRILKEAFEDTNSDKGS